LGVERGFVLTARNPISLIIKHTLRFRLVERQRDNLGRFRLRVNF